VSVGGTTDAVADTLATGGRIVWMPTIDASAHAASSLARRPSGRDGAAYAAPPVDWSAEAAIRVITRLIAAADAVLATGHLSAAEIRWLLPVAHAAGVRRILVNHPTYLVPALDDATITALADAGATIELTAYQLLHQPGVNAGRLAAVVRLVGAKRCVLSSDAGQPSTPPGPAALAMLVERLVDAGVARGSAEAMAGELPLPEALVTPR
jgi:hypothetical protein